VIVNSGAQTIEFADGSAGAPSITNSGDTNTGMFFPDADTMAFAEGGAEVMRVNSSGNVGIGTTSPQTKLDVAIPAPTGTTPTALTLTNTTDTTTNGTKIAWLQSGQTYETAWIGTIRNADASANSNLVFATSSVSWASGAPTERMRITPSGSLILVGSTAQKASGTTWSNPSDQRLKDNIRDYTKGTTELMQVRVREWEYNGKGGTTEGLKGLGVIADEVMTVLPNTVENYDAKLNADDEETTAIKKFDATEITWLLVKTVQEQQTIINDLKAELDNVKTELATLKGAPQ
jgi:hypothetical protein